MKYRYAACGLFLFALFPSLVSAITIERIAAVAGDDVITVQDLREEGATRYAIEGKTVAYIDSAPDREKKLEALTRDLVQTRLISRQAKKMDIHITDNMVDMQLQSMLHRMGQNEASLKEMLMQEGIDFNAYRNYIKNQIEAQYVIRNELVGQVEPNEADVIACAQEMAPGAERSVSVTMRQIMIPEVSADSTAGQKAPIASQLNGMWWNALDETLERYAYGVYDETKQQPDRFVEFVHKYSTGRTV